MEGWDGEFLIRGDLGFGMDEWMDGWCGEV